MTKEQKISLKKNNSCMQVLKTLQTLLQGDYTMHELIKILNKNEPYEIFNNSVISKYINTCRYIGIDIPKIHNKYYVASMPFGLELSNLDTDLLQMLQTIIKKDMATKYSIIFDNFIAKLNRYSNKKITRIEKDEFIMSFELFERAVSGKRKVKLLFKNRDILECIPLNIVDLDGKTFFKIFDKKIRMIDITRLSGVELLDKKFIEPFGGDQVTIFNLSGALAKRYEARENETIEQNNDGTITITNRNENKDILLSRLMRYQDSCEILKPKVYREDFKQLIDDTLKNYGI